MKSRKVKVQFNDRWFKKGSVEKPLYTYELTENLNKPSEKNLGKFKWDITKLTYHFSNGEKSVLEVTDEIRPMVERIMQDDENRMKRVRRKEKIQKNKSDNNFSEISLDVVQELPDKRSSYSDFEENVALKELLGELIDQLSQKQRRTIIMKFYKGMTLAEIGSLENVNDTAISKRLKLAYSKLEEMINNLQ